MNELVLTANERRIIRFLATTREDHSVNGIARACGVTPAGAQKILVKLAREGVLRKKAIANIISYQADFGSEKLPPLLELALMPATLEAPVKLRADDLAPLKEATRACVLFGSYITPKREPGDLDVLFMLEREAYPAYKRGLARAQDRIPLKVQDIVQTAADLEANLRKGDEIVIEALRKGIVLWGAHALMRVIRRAQHGRTSAAPAS